MNNLCWAFLPILFLTLPGSSEQAKHPGGSRPDYKSPLGLAVDENGRTAYVGLHTANILAIVDLQKGQVLAEVAVGKGPYDVALHQGQAFVTCEKDDVLVRVDVRAKTVTGRWQVGQAPRGVTLSADGGTAFIACHDEQSLNVVDLASGQVGVLPLPGWPERLILHRDAQFPYVLALSSKPGEALVSLVAPEPKLKILTTSKLAGVGNPRGLASKQGASSYVLVVHQNPRDKVPATQIAQGWVFTNVISSFSPWGIDTPKGGPSRAKVIDDPRQAFADPSDVVLMPDHRLAFVASGGTDTVLALRTDRFVSANYGPFEKESEHLGGRDDLSLSRHFVVGRLPTEANPRRLGLSGDGKTLVVSNCLGDSLTVIDTDRLKVVRHIALGGPEPDAARRGEVLFHSSKMTFLGQFTCASCHPGGGSDGLAWDLSRDGVGNFMNTRDLRGVKDTAPYGWLGSSPTLADRITGTLRTLHRHEPQGTEVADMTAYLETLQVPRPLPQKSPEPHVVARGKTIFEGKGKCSACHHGPALHDEIKHDVGTSLDTDPHDRFDTPSLRGLARTAPYLHHGKAATLEEVFTLYNPSQKHGGAHLLTPEELTDLLGFLKRL